MDGFLRTLEVLLSSENIDAPKLLSHVLTRGAMPLRRKIVERLIDETDGRRQVMLLRHFSQLGAPLEQMLLENVGRLGPAMRFAMSSRLATLQQAALELIRQTSDMSLAYLAGEALGSGDAEVRAAGLDMLWHWTVSIRDREICCGGPADVELGTDYRRQRKFVIEGLQKAFAQPDSPHQPRVLKAAAMLADDSASWLWRALEDRNDTRRRSLMTLLQQDTEPRMYGFVVQALERLSLQNEAAELLNRPLQPQALSHLMDEIGRRESLSDEAARLLKNVPWLAAGSTAIHKLQAEPAARALALAARSGMPRSQLSALCRTVAIGHPQSEARQAATLALTHLGEAACDDLVMVARDAPSPTGGLAVAGLARIGGAAKAADGALIGSLLRDWQALEPHQRSQAAKALAPALRSRPELLRDYLVRGDKHMTQALELLRAAPASAAYAEELKHLASTNMDHRQQSAAVAALADCMSEGVSETLRLALGSEDARVRANALEGLDQRDADAVVFLPFTNDANNRVRANAARALLHRQHPAGRETLRQMFKSNERDRVSALWVFSKLRPREFSPVATMMAGQDPSRLVRSKATELLASA